MSWTEDVRHGLARVDGSPRALRRFGLLVGGALLLLAGALAWRGRASGGWLAPGALLALLGAIAPRALERLHRWWMALALALGWVTSRLLLLLIFALLVTPLALGARLVGRRFLELRPDRSAATYWVPRPRDRRDDYTKMY